MELLICKLWFTKKYQMYTVFIYSCPLFVIPSQSVIGKIWPNLWQRRLENSLFFTNNRQKKHIPDRSMFANLEL